MFNKIFCAYRIFHKILYMRVVINLTIIKLILTLIENLWLFLRN